ncbi:MAG: hypothetical protein N2255_08795, partial [Kiritimatiellae bacterium]|nr:hypothetical protein [Kiritimatiellia bacterium]
ITAEGSVISNLERPAGVQVWNNRVVQRIAPTDYGNPCETVHPVRIVAVRGGTFGGHVGFGSTEPIEGLRASASELVSASGIIQRDCVEVYYEKIDSESFPWGSEGDVSRFETLWPYPPAVLQPEPKYGGFTQPIYLKVRVPRETAAGKYVGMLTIDYMRGIRDINLKPQPPLKVPIELTVFDWVLPLPRDYCTFVDLIQLPETVALKYGARQWSDEHFRYLKKSFDLLGEIGNKSVYLCLVTRTHFGNSETIVRWTGPANAPLTELRPDFTIMHRYLDLAESSQGKPDVVVLYLWEVYVAQHRYEDRRPPRITRFDPATGTATEVEAPAYVTPEGEAFWGAFMKQLLEQLARRGLDQRAVIGLVGDWNQPSREETAFFAKIAPGVKWAEHCHTQLTRLAGNVPIGYSTTVWNARGPADPYCYPRTYGWQQEMLLCHFPRDLRGGRTLFNYRTIPEWNIAGHQRGLGRLGGDNWNVLKRGEKEILDTRHFGGYTLIHRYPRFSDWSQLVVRTGFLACGPDGALPSVHFEALREGIQDCEARIYLEKALLEESKRARLGETLTARVKSVLDYRTWMLAQHCSDESWYFDAYFSKRQSELYSTAAEVAKVLGQGNVISLGL